MKSTLGLLAEALKETARSPRMRKAAVELTEAAAGLCVLFIRNEGYPGAF